MPCPFPWRISDFYAGGANVPAGTTGANGVIPSSGEIKFSDFYSAPIIANQFIFVAGAGVFTGIHTASLAIPRFGVWASPLPELPIFGNYGGDTDSNGVQDTTSGAILMPDGFNYGCGTCQISNGNLFVSLSRWNGSSFDGSTISWFPFNNIIINGLNWPNISLSRTAAVIRAAGISSLDPNKEIRFTWPAPVASFTNNETYNITFN